ncbi:MAG: NB-ARC domain-containing protein [Cyanobacteria bacterium P01_F01_bin.150]
MGQSVKASSQGLSRIDQARQRRGWTKTSTARWWQDAHTSRATLRRFWRQERIQHEAFVAICQTVGVNDWESIAEIHPNPLSSTTPSPSPTPSTHPPNALTLNPELPNSQLPDSQLPNPEPIDWGDAPDIEQFYDRVVELAQLQRWMVEERAKLIYISGSGGIGKTTLIVALVEQIYPDFEQVIWRSIDDLASLDSVIANLLDFPAATLQENIEQLCQRVSQQRLLLILDVLTPSEHLWGALCKLTSVRHQSCLVVICRDPLPAMFQAKKRVESLIVLGLSVDASIQLLQGCGCSGTVNQFKALGHLYSYNPLALELVSATIQTLFDGQVTPFLAQNTIVMPDPIRLSLQKQFEALPLLEKSLLFWLAIWQEPIAMCRLNTHLLNANPGNVVEALSKLVRRSLITRHFFTNEPSFSLQPMVMTFVIDELVDAIIEEIYQAQQQSSIDPFYLLRSHCLIRPGTDDILGDRILCQLRSTYTKPAQDLAKMLSDWIAIAQEQPSLELGYLAVNIKALRASLLSF